MMLGSLYLNTPAVVQQKQLIRLANVNGNGIDAADFVEMTVLMALRGDANIPTVNAIPIGPMTFCATSTGVLYLAPIVNGNNLRMAMIDVMIATVVATCCLTLPGSVGDLNDNGGFGKQRMNCVIYNVPNTTPIPFAVHMLGFWTTNPYTVHKNADATILEYGRSGKSVPPPTPPPPPSSLALFLCLLNNPSMVGHGAVNKKTDANGATVEHASTTIGATVAAASALEEEVEEPADADDAVVAATLANVDKKAILFVFVLGMGLLMKKAAVVAAVVVPNAADDDKDDDKDDAASDGVSIIYLPCVKIERIKG
eukprot:CAMPEP_0113464392 /NCGR_PEP_ID=MMETSP0014_2-20120614/13179_1 /TAXON_ID=2857 /ORGANISM="Nitzschia sp." /LENGTH=311 /DNA_ID=CAMNT_0000356475 /DNA_START=156 /DNA_END=1091 /DNA_ORIENTATION=+ /assembly_acc=CAM_ASM_000159